MGWLKTVWIANETLLLSEKQIVYYTNLSFAYINILFPSWIGHIHAGHLITSYGWASQIAWAIVPQVVSPQKVKNFAPP